MHWLVERSRVPHLFNRLFGAPMHGVAIYPFVFTISTAKEHPFVYNHEQIHIAQLEETFVLGYYIIMLISFISNLYKYKERRKAYKSIVFEVEAYSHMYNLDYLKNRKHFAWIN